MATPSTLIRHQTRGGAGSSWLYGPGYKKTMGKYEQPAQPEEEESTGLGEPDWVTNPPPGFIVASSDGGELRSTSRTMAADRLRQQGAAGADKYWTNPKTKQTFALGKQQEAPQESVAEETMLDTYEQPGLELEEEEVEEVLRPQQPMEQAETGLRPPDDVSSMALDLEGMAPAIEEEEEEEEEDRLLERKLLQLGGATPGLDEDFASRVRQARSPVATRQDATRTRETGNLATRRAPSASDLMRASAENVTGFGAATPPDVRPSLLGGEPAQPRRTDRVAGGDPRLAGRVDLPDLPMGEDEDGSGLLQMLSGLGGGIAGLGGDIGRWAKDNPELVMAGLQTIGELGGQYKRSRREQEASDAEDQERRMSTAISALTRGRVTPEVGRRAPRTTTGEGIFDVMAGIGRGGQQFLEAKRGRDEREEAMEMYREEQLYERSQKEQARKDALEERLAASKLSAAEKEEERRRWEREQGRKDREQSREDRKLDIQEEENALKRVPKLNTSDLDPEMAAVVADGVNELIRLFESGGPSETGTFSYEQTYGEGAAHQKTFDSVKKGLIGRMREFMELGRLSDKDLQIILEALPDRDRSSGYNRGVRRGIFSSLQIASQGRWQNPYDPSNKKIGTTPKGRVPQEVAPTAQPAVIEEIEELPEEVEDLVNRALDEEGNVIDRNAFEELERLGVF